MAQKDIFNPLTQQVEPADMSVDHNNEIIATFADGHFLKFPGGLTEEEFSDHIDAVEEANKGQEVITPEMEAANEAARASNLALIGETPSPEGDKTNDTPGQPAGQASAPTAPTV